MIDNWDLLMIGGADVSAGLIPWSPLCWFFGFISKQWEKIKSSITGTKTWQKMVKSPPAKVAKSPPSNASKKTYSTDFLNIYIYEWKYIHQ